MYQFLCGRLVLSLVGAVAVLQIIHIVLLNRLESLHYINNHGPQIKVTQTGSYEAQIDAELFLIGSFVERSWFLDAHGEYHVSLIAPYSSPMNSLHDISLVTQCSPDHLSDIIPLLSQWKRRNSLHSPHRYYIDIRIMDDFMNFTLFCHECGTLSKRKVNKLLCDEGVALRTVRAPLLELPKGPISLAVFTSADYVWDTLYTVASLRVSQQVVKSNATISIVWPVSPFAGLPPKTSSYKLNSTPTYNYNHRDAYPSNLLRNTARKAAFSDFIFVIDIDMMPSIGLRQEFLNMVNLSGWFQVERNTEKTVFVVPSFEGNVLPHSKEDLISSVEAGKVRPFYSQLCWKCQAHTDYETWLHWPFQKQLAVIYDVLWRDPWEPFYISHKSVPFYDERFKQYGFNRISQVCELHVSGYKFSVLNNAFLIHKNFKTQTSFHPSKGEELELNRLLFRRFKEELKNKYSESSRRCY